MGKKFINWKKLRKQIPSKIQLGSKLYYNVFWANDYKNGELNGECDYEKRQIILNMKQSDRESVVTYFHELAHAISYEYNFDLTESQVRNFERSVPYLLKNNNLFKGFKNDKK